MTCSFLLEGKSNPQIYSDTTLFSSIINATCDLINLLYDAVCFPVQKYYKKIKNNYYYSIDLTVIQYWFKKLGKS